MVKGAVAFLDPVLVETGNLKLAVDVGREYEIPLFLVSADVEEEFEPRVRKRASIKVEAMAVEPPGKGRIPVRTTQGLAISTKETPSLAMGG